MGKWKFSIGEISKVSGMEQRAQRFPADRKKNYVRYSNFHQMKKNKRLSMMWTNWWCRDQNFRKYFEMRKKHGIKPSNKGFKHTEIYDNQIKHNAQFYDMRSRRSTA